MPGDSLEFRVELVQESPLNEGLKFIMREGTLTIGAVLLLSYCNLWNFLWAKMFRLII